MGDDRSMISDERISVNDLRVVNKSVVTGCAWKKQTNQHRSRGTEAVMVLVVAAVAVAIVAVVAVVAVVVVVEVVVVVAVVV